MYKLDFIPTISMCYKNHPNKLYCVWCNSCCTRSFIHYFPFRNQMQILLAKKRGPRWINPTFLPTQQMLKDRYGINFSIRKNKTLPKILYWYHGSSDRL